MQEVGLGTTGIGITRLGLGCANLYRLPRMTKRFAVLDAAYDAGIRHFDVAPMYGLGLAEAELGRWARKKRSEVTIATKFGIETTRRARALGRVQGPARLFLSRSPNLARRAREAAPGPSSSWQSRLLYTATGFDVSSARSSLQRSLRAMGTDYVDLFLLHDPEPGSVRSDEVYDFLEGACREGKIRTWGIAGEVSPTLQVVTGARRTVPVIQVRDDFLGGSLRMVGSDSAVIKFGVLRGALTQALRYVQGNPDFCKRLTELTGANCADSGAVTALLLQAALRDPLGSTIIFSSIRPQRVYLAADAISKASRFPEDAIDMFISTMRRMISSGGAEEPGQ